MGWVRVCRAGAGKIFQFPAGARRFKNFRYGVGTNKKFFNPRRTLVRKHWTGPKSICYEFVQKE